LEKKFMTDIESETNERTKDEHGHGQDGRVHITIDGTCYEVRRGQHKVSDLKAIGNVPEAYVLVQDVQGRLVPLPDDGKVKIEGCEIFESHPRDGGSS
jgi:hypothetical protein